MLLDVEPTITAAGHATMQLYWSVRMSDMNILDAEDIARTHARADVVRVVKIVEDQG